MLSSFYHPEGTNIVFLTSGSSLSRPLVFIERFILKHWKLAFKPIVAKGSTPGFSASEWRNAKQINNFQKIIPSLKKKRLLCLDTYLPWGGLFLINLFSGTLKPSLRALAPETRASALYWPVDQSWRHQSHRLTPTHLALCSFDDVLQPNQSFSPTLFPLHSLFLLGNF